MTTRNILLSVLPITIALLAPLTAAAHGVIELRQRAAIPADSAVTLAHVAHLEGPDAEALAGVVLVPAQKTAAREDRTLSVDEVRQILNDSGRINWGRLVLRGGACRIITTPPPAPQSAPVATAAPALPEPAPAGIVSAENTIRAAVLARLCQITRSTPDELRLAFSPVDEAFLNESTLGCSIEIRPTAMSDKIPLAITLYQGDRVVGSPRTIRVGVLIQRSVLIAAAAKRRGEIIGPDDVAAEVRWLGPTADADAPSDIIGAAVKSRITIGQTVGRGDVMPAIAVSKGDIVSIRCISGTVSLTTRGRALAAGRVGDLVQFQALDSKRTFFARMDAPGRAVIASHTPTPAAASGNGTILSRLEEASR